MGYAVRMATKGASFDMVRKIALGMPDVEEGKMYGSPAVKVRGKLMACIPTNKSAEPNSLAVCVGFEQREELLKKDPESYYLKPHYENSPAVLVRLSRVSSDALRGVLELAYRFVTTKKPGRGRTMRKSKRSL